MVIIFLFYTWNSDAVIKKIYYLDVRFWIQLQQVAT
jgi:hypothetical protein